MSRFRMGIGALVLAAGCWSVTRDATPPAPEVRLDGNHALGAAVRADNLTVWPILADRVADLDEFLTLDEAQAKEAVVVREREDAAVNTIVLENKGDTPVLICAGTLVVGGKQDRQVGEDIVVAAKTETSVPAYCVEQGRWSGDGDFRSINLLAAQNVRAAGQYLQDQGIVWRGIGTSSSYPTIVRTKADEDLSERRKRYEAVVGHLAEQNQNRLVGIAHAVDGKPAGMRTFAHPKLLLGRLESLVASMCLDAEESLERQRVRAFEKEHREMVAWLRLASWAFDRGEYPLAKRNAEHALELDPECATAKEIIRISDEIRYCSDADSARVKFNAEWRRIIKEIQVASLPAFVPPQITQVGVSEDSESPLFSSIYYFEKPSTPASLRFHDARDLVARPAPPSGKPTLDELITAIRQNVLGADRAEIGWTLVDTRGERSTTNEVLLVRADPETHEAIVGFLTRLRNGAPLPAPKAEPVSRKATATDMVALFRDLEAAGATERASAGINKNSYKETDKGFQSTCRVRGKDGRWIPLTRDWTAK